MSKPTPYVCAACGGEFISERADDEAHAEARALFGRDGHAPDMAVICDDCFKAMMTIYDPSVDKLH